MEVIYRHVLAKDPYFWEWADILANIYTLSVTIYIGDFPAIAQ